MSEPKLELCPKLRWAKRGIVFRTPTAIVSVFRTVGKRRAYGIRAEYRNGKKQGIALTEATLFRVLEVIGELSRQGGSTRKGEGGKKC